MKVYVLKNKKGKYMFYATPEKDGFTDNLALTEIFTNKENAKAVLEALDDNRDYKIAEVTICEGDLEKELVVYREAFNKMAVEYAIFRGLTDVRDLQNDILDQARKELESKDERN